MTRSTQFVDLDAAMSLRASSMPIRLLIMVAIAALLWTPGGWTPAPLWWLVYAALQYLPWRLHKAGLLTDRRVIYALTAATYAVAGLPTWYLWTEVGVLGVAAAILFLAGMLVQLIVSCLGARRLFWAGAAPLIVYLVVIPPLAFGPGQLQSGLAVSVCALLFVSYMTILWIGQQRAFTEMRESRRQAIAASQAKTDFLAAMSHEVRTPMNAVLGAADLLGRTDLDAEQRSHLAMLTDGGAILMQVLNDVLDLAKIEAGKLSIDPIDVDVHDFIRRSAALWTPTAHDKGLDFDLVVSPQVPPHLRLDATRVGQILFNLVSNALKFTDSGRIALSVDVADGAQSEPELVIRVADTGIGMSDETRARLFTAFEQADGSISRRFGGSGLGLSISQKLAQMMGGRITVDSVEAAGSTFTLRLPVQVAAGHAANEPRLADPASQTRPALRILVAEDNHANQRIIDVFLRPLAAEVTIVGDGQQALDALAVSAFDLVLMDLQMPVLDGLEATRRLRASAGPNAHIPVIALTANVMDSHRQAGLDAGMTGHIAKPIDSRLLISAVINAFDTTREAPTPLEARASR